MRVLIIGCGYVGMRLGAELVREGHSVTGVRRSIESQAVMRSHGIEPVAVDITKAEELVRFGGPYDWVANLASSGRSEGEAYRKVYFEGTQRLIQRFVEDPPAKYIYTSSTGVYGQTDGSAVNEDSDCEPSGDTGRVLIETERLLLDAWREHAFPALILRVAGIYGPGRGYWLREFFRGEAFITGDGSRAINMIHRDDLVRVMIALLDRGKIGEVYNVVDSEPTSEIEVFRWLSEKTGRPMPPHKESERMGPGKRVATNKRVSNQKLVESIGSLFKYPTFREGYTAEMGAS